MHIKPRPIIAGIGSVLAVTLAVGACSTTTAARQPVNPSPTHSHRHHRLTSPFTGEPVSSLRRELIFKIDNIQQARPQTGLTRADVVYVLPMEGGLSRFMAVFSSHMPPVVGPVRSAREEDIKLLRQFGRPAFAFSGAKPRLLPKVTHAHIVNLYAGVAGGYFRSNKRIAPYNLYARTGKLLKEARHASRAHDIGFRFGAAPDGGTPLHSFHTSYPAASFTFTWSKAQQRWLVRMDGTPAKGAAGTRLGGRTVVIQYTKIGTSGYIEWGGLRPPYANTVGRGKALVLRNGRAYNVHWSRRYKNNGTTFWLPHHKRMPFARGQVWIVFAAGPGTTAWKVR